MGDYPDYTEIMHIIGSDIMVPMDIQGAYIMVPCDIQAQYVTLDIDIVAQTVGSIDIDIAAQSVGTLAVGIAASIVTLDVAIVSSVATINVDITAQTVGNIAVAIASAVTLDVDITAQTIGNLTMNISAQSVGVFLQPEWAALQGDDVDPYGYGDVPDNTLTTVLDYTVAGTHTLYINQWGINIMANSGCAGRLSDYSDTTHDYKAIMGGQMGAAQTFAKPIKVLAGHHVHVRIYQKSGAEVVGVGCFSGYLVAD